MQTRVLRRLHPRGTTGRFGAFEVTVFNAALWPGIDRLGRSERATERQRPTVYALLDQPQDAWIFSGIPTFDPVTVRAAVDALAHSFRASTRSGAIGLDQPQQSLFGAVFTHELWPAISLPSERWGFPPASSRPDQPQVGFQWNFWPAMDVQGGSFRPPAPPTQLRLDQPESGFHFGATYSYELWPGVETRADRVPARASRWVVDPVDVGWLFPTLGVFDPLTARGALDLLLASFRSDPRAAWRVGDSPWFTQDFPFDPQFTTAALQALATSYRADPRPLWRVAGWSHDAWMAPAVLASTWAAVDFLTASFRAPARPSWQVAGWPHDAWMAPAFFSVVARAALDGLTTSFRVAPRLEWRVPDQPMWSRAIAEAFDASFLPAITQLLQWERQTRISHVWDARRYPGKKLAGGPESAAPPALDPALVWAAYDFLAASFRTGKRPDARAKEWKFPFGLVDARPIMPAIRFLLDAFQSPKRFQRLVSEPYLFLRDFPFDPMFTVASTQGLRASFRSASRPSWRVWDTPQDAWVFQNAFELAFLSAIRFLAASFRTPTRPDWRAGEVADIAWTWASDPGLLWAAYQSLLDVYRTDPRFTWRITDQPSDAWLASPFNPAFWPAIERKDVPLDLRRRIWLPTEQPSFAQFDFPFDPVFITAALDALWRSFRADPRRVWLPTDEPLPAWIFENVPPPAPFDPALFQAIHGLDPVRVQRLVDAFPPGFFGEWLPEWLSGARSTGGSRRRKRR